MKNNLIALTLACIMLVSLTACVRRDNGGVQEDAGPNVNSSAGTNNGTGADGGVNDGSEAGQVRRYRQGGYVGADIPGGSEGSNIYGDIPGNPQRSAPGAEEVNPYLQDGRYRADDSGKVDGRNSSGTRDLTGEARDMVRDAGDALKDIGRDVRNAVSGQ